MSLTPTDRRILALLQADAKLGYQELGRAVGLSGPAAYQRVRRLESHGVIQGYHARVDPGAVGRGLLAFLRVVPSSETRISTLLRSWAASNEILECHRLTGNDGYLLKVRVGAPGDLARLIDATRAAGCAVQAELSLASEFERWTVSVGD